MEPAPLVEPASVTPRQMSRCRNRGWTKAWNHTQDPIPVPESPHPYAVPPEGVTLLHALAPQKHPPPPPLIPLALTTEAPLRPHAGLASNLL